MNRILLLVFPLLLSACRTQSTEIPAKLTRLSDTLSTFVTDSFTHDMGRVPPCRYKLVKSFEYIGSDPLLIERAWTGDPHFICKYPNEPLEKGLSYTMTVCFYQTGKRGAFNKAMGFQLSNGEIITFYFKGTVIPPEEWESLAPESQREILYKVGLDSLER